MSIPAPTVVFVERLGLIVGVALVACMVFTTVAPYFIALPPTSVRLIDQQQTILQSVLMVLVGYLWGNSAGNKLLAETANLQAKTALTAGAALTGEPPGPTVKLEPGEQATVKAEESL